MKAKSIASVATLVGVAAALNFTALAGPGPQSQVQPRKVSERQEAVAAKGVRKNPNLVKTETKPERSLFYVSGPKGGTFAFR